MSLPPYDQTIRDFERHFQVVLPDGVGQATVGFRDGVWYRLNSGAPHPVPIRSAIILCPHAAGSIVQIGCWWMRENARSPRALDLATELALTVGELARKAIEDDPLGMSLNTLSMASQPAPAAISPLPASSPLGSAALGASGSFAGASAYDTGSYSTASYSSGSYSTDPYASAQPPAPSYEPAYAAAPPVAATTLIPQITPEMTAPSSGRPLGVPRPSGPAPGLTPLPPGTGRPAQAGPGGPGYGAPRGPMPGGRPPMGPGGPGTGGPGMNGTGQTGSWDRPGAPDPRSGRPAGGPPPRQAGPYDGSEPRDDFFRSAPPQQRRPEDYGGRPQSRPVRPEAGRSW